MTPTRRYVCIHGHFYQPPRENPWLGTIERQESAGPHHDWNERITAECYAPNAAARILGEKGAVRRVVSNYARMSFNFGPTLLSYLESSSPQVYRAILDADRASRELHGGHGSALAQAYNHTILPLTSREDKRCQVAWGIRDFEHRFGRRPEGLWLPETAVDVETLEVLAEERIRFTILAPHQARRVRPTRKGPWRDLEPGTIDTRVPYEQLLPSGRTIALFFYDASLAHAVAFEGLLDSGAAFVDRLLGGFAQARDEAQLVHLATDGETYGHHRKFGEMALAYTLDAVETRAPATLTNYASFLNQHPPRGLVEVAENTSWSCSHGVERWRGDCDCGFDAHPEWNRAWRMHLRAALDWLRDRLARLYEERSSRFLDDPWEARRGYIDVLLDGGDASRERFLSSHGSRPLSRADQIEVWKLMQMQHHSMLMQTSCGWFFEDLSRIEAVQVLCYAARAAQLARELSGEDPEPELLERLERATSNRPGRGTGREIYLREVRPRSKASD